MEERPIVQARAASSDIRPPGFNLEPFGYNKINQTPETVNTWVTRRESHDATCYNTSKHRQTRNHR